MPDLLHANDPQEGHPASWYAATGGKPPRYLPLRGEVRCDLAIVGGGFTGLAAALAAAEVGASVVLVEARRVGFGASGRNGGQVGSGQRLSLSEMEARFGADRALDLWRIGEEAKATCRRLVAAHAPGADWRPGIAHLEYTARGTEATMAEARHTAARTGYAETEALDAAAAERLTGSPRFAGGVLDRGAGHLHPLRLAYGLARAATAAGAAIHEDTRTHRVTPGAEPVLHTDRGRVVASRILLAGNGYLRGLSPRVDARVLPINNFVVATEPLPGLMAEPVAAYDSNFVVNYWRQTPDHRLLFGGGETWGHRFPRDVAALVRRPLERVYPQLKGVRIDHAWGGTLAITVSRLPLLSEPAPGVLNASGYSGHGVALACHAGTLAARRAAGPCPDWDAMAVLPARPFPGGRLGRAALLPLAMGAFALRDRIGL